MYLYRHGSEVSVSGIRELLDLPVYQVGVPFMHREEFLKGIPLAVARAPVHYILINVLYIYP